MLHRALCAVSVQQIHSSAVPFLLPALCMCTAGIKTGFPFYLGHSPAPLSTRSVGRAGSVWLSFSRPCLVSGSASFPSQASRLCLARRHPHSLCEGDTPPVFPMDPDSMLGCLLTQSLVTRLEGLLGSTITSAPARGCPCWLLSPDPASSCTQHTQAPGKLSGD